MDRLEKLYNLYLEFDLISEAVSLEQFKNANREQQAGLYELGKEGGVLGTTTFAQFGEAFLKKKDLLEIGTDSPSDTGFLGQPETDLTPQQQEVRGGVDTLIPPAPETDDRSFMERTDNLNIGTMLTQAQEKVRGWRDNIREKNIEKRKEKEALKEREMDVVVTASALQTLDFDQLLPYEQVKVEQLAAKYNLTPQEWLKEVEKEKDEITEWSFGKRLYAGFEAFDKEYLGAAILDLPATIYSVAASLTDPLFHKITGKTQEEIDAFPSVEERATQVNKLFGTDTMVESLIKEADYIKAQTELWDKEEGISGGIVENFREGNSKDGWRKLAITLAESAPITIGIMMSSMSGVGLARTATGATALMTSPELRTQREENPEQSDFKTMTKAVGLAAAEMVFTTITSGTLGKVYKDIIFKQGVEVGSQTFKRGLISMYEQALKKYGVITQGLAEGIEEVATQVTQNAINGLPLYQGVPDAFVAGFAGGEVYASPLALNQGRKFINEKVAETKINTLLKPTEFNNITTAFESPTIGDLQFDLSKVKRSDVILDKELKKRVESGEMTEAQAEEVKQNFFDTSIIDVKLDATSLTGEQKVQAANLLRERDGLQKQIDEVDDASLTAVEQERIAEIDTELTSLSKISVTESVEVDTPSINVAPLFATTIETVEDALELRKGDKYKQQIQTINDILEDYNITGEIEESIGGYKNKAGEKIVEISNVVRLGEGTTREQADQIASLLGALAPESQESSIAADYVDETDTTQNGFEYVLNVSDVQGTLEALKEAGITDFTLNDQNNSLSLLDLDFMDTQEFLDNLGALEEILEKKQIEYDIQEQRAINSRFITKTERGKILSSLKESSIQQQLEGTNLYKKVEQAIARDSETTTDQTQEGETTTEEVVEETVEAPQDEVQSLIETINDPSAGIQETIEIGRERGFSDAAIQKVLQGRGFRVRDIKPALEEGRRTSEEAVGIPLPAAFANIPGGIKVGQPLFEEIQKKLNELTGKENLSRGEIREKALELLRASEVYQNLETIEQQELDLALDRAIGTTANRKIQQEIKGIREQVKKFKEGVKNLKKAQADVTKFIRNVLPGSANIKKFVASINKVTSKQDLPAVAEKIVKDIQRIREAQKQKIIKQIQTLARKKGAIRKTRSNKSRGGDISAQGKQFFQEVNKVLKVALGNDATAYDNMLRELNFTTVINKETGQPETVDSVARVNELTLKELAGEKLTQEESAFLDRQTAIELFADIQSKSLEEVQDLLTDLKQARSQAIADLNKRKELRALRAKELQDKIQEEIREEYPFLFDEEGNLLSENDLSQKRIQTSIWNILNGKGVWKNLRDIANEYRTFTAPKLTAMLRNTLYHMGTIAYQLDGNVEGGMFSEYFYKRLNIADNKALEGKFYQMDKLNEIASSIEGVNSYNDLRKLFGYEQLEINTTVEGKKKTWKLSKDNLARIYALSLNEQQAAMLEKDGFNAEKIEEVKEILGKEIVEFVDKTVTYLSTENYEGVNEVYREVNDINLPRIDNYFPTKTVRETPIDELITNMNRGEFSNLFNAETAPLLARTNVKGEINLNPNETFLNTLTNHLETTERYKAFAKEVETLNTLIKTPSVVRLMKTAMHVDVLVKQLVNNSINPYAMSRQLSKGTSFFMSNYTGVALSLKVVQFFKQATSFINAFEQYRLLPKDAKRNPLEFVLDVIGFAGDMAFVWGTAPYQVYQSYQMSPSFRDRLKKGLGGDLTGLEAGGELGRSRKKIQQWGWRMLKGAFAFPTVMGDIMGVLGYKAVYNANIRKGMSPEKALNEFNDYNATQQTRRGGERNTLQNSPDNLTRAFTMFLSTTFLQINKTVQGMGGIMRSLSPYDGKKLSIKNIERPKAKDIRAVSTNLVLANMLFIGAANFAKFAFGDDKDVEEAWSRVWEAPLQPLFSIPLLGAGAELVYVKSFKENQNFLEKQIVNPYYETAGKLVRKIAEIDKEVGEDKRTAQKIKAVLTTLGELFAGTSVTPVEGTYKSLRDIMVGNEVEPDDIYDALGVSRYYRPEEKEKKALKIPSSGSGSMFDTPEMKEMRKRFNAPRKKIRDAINKRFKDRLKRD